MTTILKTSRLNIMVALALFLPNLSSAQSIDGIPLPSHSCAGGMHWGGMGCVCDEGYSECGSTCCPPGSNCEDTPMGKQCISKCQFGIISCASHCCLPKQTCVNETCSYPPHWRVEITVPSKEEICCYINDVNNIALRKKPDSLPCVFKAGAFSTYEHFSLSSSCPLPNPRNVHIQCVTSGDGKVQKWTNVPDGASLIFKGQSAAGKIQGLHNDLLNCQ